MHANKRLYWHTHLGAAEDDPDLRSRVRIQLRQPDFTLPELKALIGDLAEIYQRMEIVMADAGSRAVSH